VTSRRHGHTDHVTGKSREVWWFQTIATCRDGLTNSRDKSATSPFASRKRGNQRRPRQDTGKSATSATRHGEVGDVVDKSTGTSWVCREVGTVEFGLYKGKTAPAGV